MDLHHRVKAHVGGTSQFSYDGNGNATTYKGNTLTYDEENHLTSFTTASGSTPLRAVYRSDGLRGWKQVSSGNRYFFLYDGDQIVCGFDGSGNLSRINVWGASGLIGRQSGTNGGTPVYDYAWDDKGNISQVLNTNSSVASNYLVSAWGEASTDSAAYDPYRCMGGQFGNYFDAETGLILCGQRYYDPSGGRWINRDPISYDGGLNVYGYVSNNPTNYTDPDGLTKVVIAEYWNWGVSRREMRRVKRATERMFRSPRGRQLAQMIVKRGYPVDINVNNSDLTKCWSVTGVVDNTRSGVWVDPTDRPWVPVGRSGFKGPKWPEEVPLEILIGHEVGHDVTGLDDKTRPGDPIGDNVRWNENPIRRWFGFPLRLAY